MCKIPLKEFIFKFCLPTLEEGFVIHCMIVVCLGLLVVLYLVSEHMICTPFSIILLYLSLVPVKKTLNVTINSLFKH